MNRSIFNAARVRGLILALGLVALAGLVRGQGTIVYMQPNQPIYYGPVAFQTGIDVNGDGTPDFTLFGPAPETSVDNVVLAPLGSNRLIAIPEPPPDTGYLVAALNQGALIGPSLAGVPGAEWYSNQTDQYGHALIGAMAGIDGQISVIGYFAGKPSAYIGFDLYYDGASHYGWMQVENPLAIVAGQVVDWAYQTSPNTPILAGQVPEPPAWTLATFGATILALIGRLRLSRRQ